MRVKLGLMIVVSFLTFGLLTSFYILRNLEDQSKDQLKQSLRQSFLVYTKAQRASREERLDLVRAFSREGDILNAFTLPSETPKEAEDRHFELFKKMEVISNLRYGKGELFIALDAGGNELARTRVAQWRNNRYGEKLIVREALQGRGAEDIWIVDGKTMVVDAAPLFNNGAVIGAMLMGNTFNDDFIRQEKDLVFGQFAVFSATQILTSSLNSDKQVALSEYVQKNGEKIASVLMAKDNTPVEERILLGEEYYIAEFSRIPTLSNQGHAGYILLANEDQWLSAIGPAHNVLAILTLIMIIVTFGLGMVIVQKGYDAVDFVLEGVHQIIMGNKDFEFQSKDKYMSQIGQSLNIAIAILLGKYIPDDEEDANRMAAKGGFDAGVKNPAERLMIQTMDAEAESEVVDGDDEEETYYDKLYADFVSAKRKCGEDTKDLSRQLLVGKLNRAAEKLAEKHDCQKVRFRVRVEGGKVSFKPFPINCKQRD